MKKKIATKLLTKMQRLKRRCVDVFDEKLEDGEDRYYLIEDLWTFLREVETELIGELK